MQEVKIGTYTGSGSVTSVIIGFPPDRIEANTHGGSEIWRWQTPMSSGTGIGIHGATGSLLCIESKGYVVLTDAMRPSGQGFRAH